MLSSKRKQHLGTTGLNGLLASLLENDHQVTRFPGLRGFPGHGALPAKPRKPRAEQDALVTVGTVLMQRWLRACGRDQLLLNKTHTHPGGRRTYYASLQEL